MTDTKTITNLAEVREGDMVTAEREGHRFIGEAWFNAVGNLYAGGALLRWSTGETTVSDFLSATREVPVPTLPTEPGSIGRATVDGVPDILIYLTDDNDAAPWLAMRDDGFREYVRFYDIDASTYRPARLVFDDERVEALTDEAIEAAADKEYRELPLAPENERLAEVFIEGATWARAKMSEEGER